MKESILAAIALLEAAQERAIALDETGVAYDWPAEEARLMALAGLEAALDDESAGLLILRTAAELLPQIAVGEARGAFSLALAEALRRSGLSLPALALVAGPLRAVGVG